MGLAAIASCRNEPSTLVASWSVLPGPRRYAVVTEVG